MSRAKNSLIRPTKYSGLAPERLVSEKSLGTGGKTLVVSVVRSLCCVSNPATIRSLSHDLERQLWSRKLPSLENMSCSPETRLGPPLLLSAVLYCQQSGTALAVFEPSTRCVRTLER